MARSARRTAALRATLASLEDGAASRRMPNLSALIFRVPQKFDQPRIWDLMRRQLPKIVFANPECVVKVESPAEGQSLNVHVQFTNMPERTIVFGDKSATEIAQELLTMGRFSTEQSR